MYELPATRRLQGPSEALGARVQEFWAKVRALALRVQDPSGWHRLAYMDHAIFRPLFKRDPCPLGLPDIQTRVYSHPGVDSI